MFDVSVFSQFLNPTILVICLAVGFIIKNWVSSANNNIIPTVVFILGIILAVAMALLNNEPFNFNIIATGAISGLASTGLHQLLKTWIEQFGKSN